jgi:hypothetical protein
MSAPERIWANPDHWIEHPPRRDAFRPEEYAEYVRADLCDPMQDERVKALVEAAKRVREDFEDMREVFDGLASGTSVTTWPEMDPCGPMDAWMEGERLLRAALRDMGVE